ncbi:MAG: T9SS type A sorting domain-containing protein [Bacteroidetes bacterium]|nr:T9SS type A sorting domain-containing protein [Bacteroidota bacterium]
MKKLLFALLSLFVINNVFAACSTSFTVVASPSGNDLLRVALTNASSATAATNQTAQSYVYWGDGNSTYIGFTGIFYHTYNTPGTYNISVTTSVLDLSTGTFPCKDSVQSSLSVNYTPCATSFSYSSSGTRVNAVANNPAGTTHMTYTWEWGDSTDITTGQTSSHVYPNLNGKYVILTATDSNGCTYRDTQLINMGPLTLYDFLTGTIYQDSAAAIPYPQYKIWLIGYNAASTTLYAIDSQTITGGATGYKTNYQFDSLGMGDFRVKVKLLNGPVSGTGALPTYNISALRWDSAFVTTHYSTYSWVLGRDIHLRYGIVTNGPGFIGGNVSAGANKGTKDGIPGMNVFLIDDSKKAIAYAVTDINGDYSFSKIPVGNYSIYPEDMNYTTTPGTATVAANNTTIANVDFLRSQKYRTITPNTTGISSVKADVLNIYPNPTKDRVIITLNNRPETKSDLAIINTNGQKLYQQSFNGNHAEVDLKGWSKGVYFIKIENDNINVIRKIVLE